MTDDLHPELSALSEDEPPDPSIAEEFRALTAVRDLVAGLSRPASPDVSDAVLRRIASRRQVRHVARSAVAAAAVLIVGGAVAFSAGRSRGGSAAAARRPGPLGPPPVTVAVAAEPAAVRESAPPRPTEPEAAPEMVGPVDDRPMIARRLLERPGPYRIFLAPVDRAAEAVEVAKLVGLSSHRDFHRFDLPATDGASGDTVFAAVLDAGELRTLRMRLVEAMPDALDESETEAAVVVDVAQAGTATTLRGDPAAEILVPQQQLALRLPPEVPAPAVAQARTPAVDPGTTITEDEGPSVVLIWLMSDGR